MYIPKHLITTKTVDIKVVHRYKLKNNGPQPLCVGDPRYVPNFHAIFFKIMLNMILPLPLHPLNFSITRTKRNH